jgi:SEC-C motif-containing protein
LLDTWHPDTRPANFNLALDTDIKWLGLQVIAAKQSHPTAASVEFIARYRHGGGRAERMHEVSQFIYTDAWYYLTGEVS